VQVFGNGRGCDGAAEWNGKYSKVTGLLPVRRENPLQSRPSQGYLIANAQSGSRIAQEARTRPLSCLPRRVSQCLRVLGPCLHHRHHLGFSWLAGLPLVYGERAHLRALARHGPAPLASQHYRRLLCAP
jgi:hypothetical protein